ncbi:hypothetical protein JR316_0002049 [Psilocybe cubensis]|uniref:F-box domain-containing protein n=2 Tax=Psilocybe cubensis TaxID=181762 RepID=A0A8H7Y777_PSICU|nr:hypothetical protein JR316_0002049 [Psilocybe cubensis]KAH9485142.1 hypothetical protein JR316_0002049 [Psilocybe cubensis]
MSIYLIPPEILSDIFRRTLSSDHDDNPISSNTGPMLLIQVCRTWRHVAVSDSSLWSSLRINVSHATGMNHPCIVELWLKRSAFQPLTITVWIDPFSHLNREAREIVQTILHMLSNVSERWVRLSMTLPASNRLFAEFCSSQAPNLELLSFKIGNWSMEEAQSINTLLRHAPALRTLQWSNRCSWGSWDAPFDSGMQHLRVSWANLTDILLDTWITLKTALEILQRCDNLVNLDLRHFSYNPELLFEPNNSISSQQGPALHDRLPYTHLPYLESLTIYQLKLDEGLSLLMERIFVPKLIHFNFTCGFIDHVKWPQASFHNLITRSASHLQSLMLEYTGISQDQLIQCLQDCSTSLRRLEVYDARGDICVGDTLLEMLRAQTLPDPFTYHATLCNNLTTLILHRVVECTDGALAQTLESRTSISLSDQKQQRCAPLRHADIIFSKCFFKTNQLDLHYLESSFPKSAE